MKKILLYYSGQCADQQVFPPINYHEIWRREDGRTKNSGNKLFYQACEQYLTKKDIEYFFLTEDMSPDYINQNFDLIVLPTANIFNRNRDVLKWLQLRTEEFKKYTIPVFVLGAGAQTDSYDDFECLSKDIKEIASEFIRSVYKTGGEFALRGYFTEELFHKWGFYDAVVTGCPSLYQAGKNLNINKKDIEEKYFVPAVNGNRGVLDSVWMRKQFKRYEKSYFVDQDLFFDLFYNKSFQEKNPIRRDTIGELVSRFSELSIELLEKDKIKLFYDIPLWKQFLQENEISFTFGQRIHGSIVSILSNVPAVVYIHDSRTRELAEFFNIPQVKTIDENKTVYDIYRECNYNKFNREFPDKFEKFNMFLEKHGITYDINDSSLFIKKLQQQQYEQARYYDEQYVREYISMGKKTKYKRKIISNLDRIKYKFS